MKYTREQLDLMSDFDVNKAIASLQPYTKIIGTGEYPSQSDSAVHVEKRQFKHGNFVEFGIDYCRNWDDIMPLAVEHWVFLDNGAVIDCEHRFIAYSETMRNYGEIIGAHYEFSHDNPQRAIACCLILVLQDKE